MNHQDLDTLALADSVDGDSVQGIRSTAVSSKIASVLSTSFADAEIREALKTLDERHVQNTAEARRRLRLDVQKEVIECNGDIVKDFGHVAEQLRRIGSIVSSLNACCEDIRKHVIAAHQEMGPMLDEADTLLSQKQEVETKKQIFEAFNEHFVLSEDELDVLTSSHIGVNDEFFSLLTRLKRVHSDCQILLGSEDQQLGLELMDRSSRNLNSAFQKLYRWVENEFKTLDLENPRINASIRRAIRVLAERPALFQACLEVFATAREKTLSDAFYSALTGSSTQTSDTTTKPMEYYSHDALRFVGDMLAWTHSAAVSERETLEVLFISEGEEIAKGIKAGMDNEPWLHEDQDVFDGRRVLDQLVNRDLSGVARALKQRVEQVIQSDEDPVLAYKLANLIDFYRVTLGRLLGSQSAVLDTLLTMKEFALRQYHATIKEQTIALPAEQTQAPPDLSLPGFLVYALDQLRELMKSFDLSLSPTDSRDAEFQPVTGSCLDPCLHICEQMAKGLSEPQSSIFALNCLFAVKSVLSAYPFTAERISEVDDTIDEYAARLIGYQHAYFMHTSGLHPLHTTLASLADSEDDLRAIFKLGPFQAQALTDASQTLDDFLPSALMDATENLKLLKTPRIVEEITDEAAALFCEDFEFVEGRLMAADDLIDSEEHADKASGEEDHPQGTSLRSIFPRTSEEIRVLLS